MNWKCYVGCGVLFFGGLMLGSATVTGGKYQAGRLSACNDLTGVITQLNPFLALVGGIKCVTYKDDVAIQLGEKKYSLDGKTELK